MDIENKVKLEILKKYNTKEIYGSDLVELSEMIGEKNAIKILNCKNLSEAEQHLKIMKENNIKLISVRDYKYPEKLKFIQDNPAFLYVRGNEDILDDDSVGIVGCRYATNEGKKIARYIGKELTDRNINVISGLAIGIDKYAHLGALDSDIGKTIAVLGCGVSDDDIYPYQNKKVFERILEKGGAIVSEYCIGSKPEKEHFPKRNRIISGLSDKIIVVEAKIRSGSLITANWGLEQGKDIFAVPGNIFNKNSIGTNNLIKDGAFLFSDINDLFYL